MNIPTSGKDKSKLMIQSISPITKLFESCAY